MRRRNLSPGTVNGGGRVRELRRAKGLSRTQVADWSGLSRRRIALIERGRVSPAESDLRSLAAACGVQVEALASPGSSLVLTAAASSNGAIAELRGEEAFDALLREYISMVLELRGARQASPASLRQDDLRELAHALGDTPDAIEARLMELLGTDRHEAWELRTTILPGATSDT